MIRLQQTAEGVILEVRAHAGARKTGITGEHDGRLKVSVSQAPEKGKANTAIVEVLSQALALSKNQIELLSGAASSEKRFLLRGIEQGQLATRLEALRSR